MHDAIGIAEMNLHRDPENVGIWWRSRPLEPDRVIERRVARDIHALSGEFGLGAAQLREGVAPG
jgi:hypothetical protein